MKEQGKVEVNIQNNIASITFYHPKSNSMPGALLKILTEEINAAGENPEVKVIILKSAGEGAFCAGASFDELLSIGSFEQGKDFFMGFAHVINAMRKCPKFIIGRIHGKAVGGGVGLAAGVDYALALNTASVKLSEFALGIGPFVVGPAVERKIGRSAFSQMTIDTEWYDAFWAKEKGLYTDVFSNMFELDNAVISLAEKLTISSPEAAYELKKVFWEGCDNWDELLESRAGISGRLVMSEFTTKAIEAFRSR
jgi:methylglutaconyl-CoA hydratase